MLIFKPFKSVALYFCFRFGGRGSSKPVFPLTLASIDCFCCPPLQRSFTVLSLFNVRSQKQFPVFLRVMKHTNNKNCLIYCLTHSALRNVSILYINCKLLFNTCLDMHSLWLHNICRCLFEYTFAA